MAEITANNGGWSGTIELPLASAEKENGLYLISVAKLSVERDTLYALYHLGEGPMNEIEYDYKTAILDDLESQFLDKYLASVSGVVWQEV